MEMNKPRLIKKEDVTQELRFSRKSRKSRKPAPSAKQQAVKATAEWLQSRQARPSAREAFAALFAEPEAQSA
jgi:hypothetical protein